MTSAPLRSTRHPRLARRAAAVVLCAALGLPAPTLHAQVRLPALGETASEDFTVGTERRIGEQIMAEIRRDPAFLDDPVLQEYLQALWDPLVAAARRRGDVQPDVDRSFAWDAFLVRDRSVNAFALPGGYVGVHLGLIAMTATGDELASVLAHELTHVTQRHIARGVVNSQRASMIGLATMILGILAASRAGSADMANAAIMGGQGAAAQGQLNFSRDVEREADRIGFSLLGLAGFSPAGMASMFDKLDSANRLNDSGAFPYLRSHPLTVERISEARSRALNLGPAVRGGDADVAPPLLHALMQQRARVRMDGDPQTLRRLAQQAAGVPGAPLRDRAAALYAGALAALLLADHDRAARLTEQTRGLLAEAPRREPAAERAAALLAAEVALARGDAPGALGVLGALDGPAGAGTGPATGTASGRAPLLLRAQAVLAWQRQGGPAQAELRRTTEALQTWVADHRGDAAAWAALGATAEAIGLKLRSLRALAESHAQSGDLAGAIDRLRAGQLAARSAEGQDFIEASVIDARLRELQAQRRQLALEARGGRGPGEARDEPLPQ